MPMHHFYMFTVLIVIKSFGRFGMQQFYGSPFMLPLSISAVLLILPIINRPVRKDTTLRAFKQRRIRRACASVQSYQSLQFCQIKCMNLDEGSDKKNETCNSRWIVSLALFVNDFMTRCTCMDSANGGFGSNLLSASFGICVLW